MAVAAAQYEDRIRIAEVEGAAIARLLREKWRTEFDKRKRLHNLVSGEGGLRCEAMEFSH